MADKPLLYVNKIKSGDQDCCRNDRKTVMVQMDSCYSGIVVGANAPPANV